MILTAWRDLQFRRRRVAIAVLGTALVFALGLIMTGIAAAFTNEVQTSVAAFRAEGWLRPASANGSFIASKPFATAPAPTAADLGITRADPVLFRNTSLGRGEKDQLAYFGVVRGGLGDPEPTSGRRLQKDGEIIVDRKTERKLGDTVTLGGRSFTIVGFVKNRSILAGVPLAYMSITDAQQLAVGGQPLANTVALSETPKQVPSGWKVDRTSDAKAELLQPLHNATKTINLVRGLLWLVAGLIVGSVMYLQALERTRDFAVLKATGSSSRSIGGSLALQAVFLTLVASAIALVLGAVLAPQFPMNVAIPRIAYLALPFVAVAIGLLATITGLRRSLSVEPAFAFRGA